jgi:hypothetical protein
MVRPSNGTEGEAWVAAWCHTCAEDVEENCPILLASLIFDDGPPQWHRGPMWSPQTAIYCTAYHPRPARTLEA